MLVRDIFIAMMEVVGATTLDEVPEASEMQKCLRHVNLMLDSWSARDLLQLATVQENFPLVAGQRAYTIGPSANFNTAKPIEIVRAFVRDAGGNDYPIDVKTVEIYESYGDKMISSARPAAIYYDPGVTQQAAHVGTINCYPIPDSSSDRLYFDSQKYFTEFSGLTDNVAFTPAYFRAIVYNGAEAIWRPMGRKGPIPGDIHAEAVKSMQIIENMNARPIVAGLDLPGCKTGRGGYNIYTDQS
jgi:hypothetical protein